MVVGVVTPPHAHPNRRLQTQCLPAPPQRVQATDRLKVFPPLCRPTIRALRANATRVCVAQPFAHELVNRAREQRRLDRDVRCKWSRIGRYLFIPFLDPVGHFSPLWASIDVVSHRWLRVSQGRVACALHGSVLRLLSSTLGMLHGCAGEVGKVGTDLHPLTGR